MLPLAFTLEIQSNLLTWSPFPNKTENAYKTTLLEVGWNRSIMQNLFIQFQHTFFFHCPIHQNRSSDSFNAQTFLHLKYPNKTDSQGYSPTFQFPKILEPFLVHKEEFISKSISNSSPNLSPEFWDAAKVFLCFWVQNKNFDSQSRSRVVKERKQKRNGSIRRTSERTYFPKK